jgi:prenyltransferase beta subunit
MAYVDLFLLGWAAARLVAGLRNRPYGRAENFVTAFGLAAMAAFDPATYVINYLSWN